MLRRLFPLLALLLCLEFVLVVPAQSATPTPTGSKELNFIILHGAAGTTCDEQMLVDSITEQLSAYIENYEGANPGMKIKVNFLARCYPNDVAIDIWAENVADSVNKYLPDKSNLILVGHSMGGKAALYAVAKNVGNLTEKTAMVVTIDSPVKSLNKYYAAGGAPVVDYCRTRWLLSGGEVCNSVAYYDSSEDGLWVGKNKHWLALIAGENAPSSKQFDIGELDGFPGYIDDGVIPISAQYADGADIVYYGEHGHSDFREQKDVADVLAGEILYYIFGGTIECSVFAKSGNLEHKADWLLGTDYWQDLLGDNLWDSGTVWHWNDSYTVWQEWDDTTRAYSPEDDERSRFEVTKVRSFPLFTSIKEMHWLEPDNLRNFQVYLKTRAAPQNYLQVDYNIYRRNLLPAGVKRDRYEVEIASSTPLTQIRGVTWASDDPRDLRLQIWTQAESPFQWLKVNWRVYKKEPRQRNVIDEMQVS